MRPILGYESELCGGCTLINSDKIETFSWKRLELLQVYHATVENIPFIMNIILGHERRKIKKLFVL